jgi:hypothetical protein
MITICPIYITELANQVHPNCEYTIFHGKKALSVLLSWNRDEISSEGTSTWRLSSTTIQDTTLTRARL